VPALTGAGIVAMSGCHEVVAVGGPPVVIW